MTGGRLIGVVGPSGVGKDTVMAALATARPDLHIVRRCITRPASVGGECFTGLEEADFRARATAGEFVLHWPAHGLRYGIPANVREVLADGQDALVNLSRAVLPDAQRRFAGFVTLNLTAPPDVLAERLAARGREPAEEISARLRRAGNGLPDGLERVVHVANDGPLRDTVRAVLDQLYPEKV
ncbi:phosphonate metabolism protein/1,5-bisphosphokinase (PRPP-forming) PhnN [Roseovarius sp. TE539]|uniref:phosphonate metabolism protein/1,5-bisphosphokinase (PRPP-forming) PhnN n=1 Tax=Roseovarius sp. TE539 TaxID=2249812 RepID=UPI000DDFA07E|nr:phosphonate metabolism protein/1,5-bisphosphokinase (PRPP-forming) PhnN [Roseovarius sp. TE539]RBI68331.1 phosphonate metabolism protein/1,5-bisphosphokinase (PRPP-forming) PhnN [Roseovarius sp. TE539]